MADLTGKKRAFDPLVTSDRHEEEDGSGSGDAIAILSTMVNSGIITDELGMFPDDEALFESPYKPDTFGHKHPFVDVSEVEDYIIGDSQEQEEDGGIGIVVLDATVGEEDEFANDPLGDDRYDLRAVVHKYDRGYKSPQRKKLPPMFKIRRRFERGVVSYQAVPAA